MIIDGKKIAEQIYQQLKIRIQKLGVQPVLCDVVVGSDPVTMSFVRAKKKWAETIGIKFIVVDLPEDAKQEEIRQVVLDSNHLPGLCGLIVQLPLPQQLDTQLILDCINTDVDVDCLNSASQEKFYQTGEVLTPPTAGAIMHILDTLPIDLSEEKILLIGRGLLVGKPVARLLQNRGLSFQVASSITSNLPELLADATVVISGIGKAGIVTPGMLADNAIVIDAGTSESGGSIKGDIGTQDDVDGLRFITPVPGGVGPVTVAKLLMNVVQIAEQKLV